MNVLKRRIEYTFGNNWSTNDQDIQVLVEGHKVTLHGCVDSPYQKDQAEKLVWFISEVWSVENELVVNFYNQQIINAQGL